MSRQTQQTKSLFEVWDVLLRFRWRFIVPAFLVMTGVLTVSLVLPRKYQADALFERRTDMVLSEITTRTASQGLQTPSASLAEEVAGQPAIDDLIETLKAQAANDPRHAAVVRELTTFRSELSRKVLVRNEISTRDLDRIRVSFTGVSPEVSRLVVNNLVEGYIRRTRANVDSRLKQAAEFFEGEVTRERKTIEELENKMLNFEISHAELLPDSPLSVQNSLSSLEADASELEQKLQAASMRVKALKESLVGTATSSISSITARNPDLDRLEGKKRQLEAELANCVGTLKMTDRHPDLIVLREQIAEIDKQIAGTQAEVVTEKHTAANPKRAELELMLTTAAAERSGYETQLAAVRDRIGKLAGDAADLFPVRSDYRKLSRDVEQHQRQLTFWEDNLRRVRMALTAESGDRGIKLDFIKPCSPITRPISPDLTQVLLAAIALSVLAGAGSVFFAHRTDESFGTGDALAGAMGLQLFGSVSEIISRRQRRVRRLRNLFVYPANAAAMGAVMIALMSLLYMNLERPDLFEEFRQGPAKFLLGKLPVGGGPTTPKARSDRCIVSFSICTRCRSRTRPIRGSSTPASSTARPWPRSSTRSGCARATC
jgi:uncharacterized protein involved in exopolysaccharide biosynthesis